MTTLPLETFLDADHTVGEMKTQFFGLMLDVHTETPGGAAEATQNIASGAITPALKESRAIQIDTEGATATDELTTITNTNVPPGAYVQLRSTNASKVIECQHNIGGAGKMLLRDGVSYFLDDPDKRLLLQRIGTDFEEVWRSHPKAPEPDAETATTSGTTSDKTGISPNARRITCFLDQINTSVSATNEIQLGDSGGFQTTGYTGSIIDHILAGGTQTALSTGFTILQSMATTRDAILILELIDPTNHIWMAHGQGGDDAGLVSHFSSIGRKALTGGPLSQLRLTTSAGTFSAGGWRIRVEE